MTDVEAGRLTALEHALMGAAVRQTQQRRRRRRRVVVLLAVAAPLLLAAAASVAGTQGFFGGVDQQFATLRDDRLIPDAPPSVRLSVALGATARDRASQRTWFVAGRRVTGYTTADGSFCYSFAALTGGCIQPGELDAANPIAPTVDYGPQSFVVYGLAIDDVKAVSLRVRGVTRRVHLVSNAFYLADDALGGTRELTGTLIVRLRGGELQRVAIRSEGGSRPNKRFLPALPGVLPAGDAAA